MTSSSQHSSDDPVKAFFAMLASINKSMMTLQEVLASNPAVKTAERGCEASQYQDFETERETYYFETYVEATTGTGENFVWSLDVMLTPAGWALKRIIAKQEEHGQDIVSEFDDPAFSNTNELTEKYSILVAEFVESANNFDFNI
jgi:hypothetical protein